MPEETVTIPKSLFEMLYGIHETNIQNDPFGRVSYYLVWCSACDGDHRHMWRTGDPDYSCAISKEVQKYL